MQQSMQQLQQYSSIGAHAAQRSDNEVKAISGSFVVNTLGVALARVAGLALSVLVSLSGLFLLTLRGTVSSLLLTPRAIAHLQLI